MKIHEGNHTGEKPFNCTWCGKSLSVSKYLKSTSRGSMRERNHWSLRKFSTSLFMKEMTLERINLSAQSVARASYVQETWNYIRGSLKETTIELHQMWEELFHIRWSFMKEIKLERSHSIAQTVTRVFQDQKTWSTIRESRLFFYLAVFWQCK